MREKKSEALRLADELDAEKQGVWVWAGNGYRHEGAETKPLSAKAAALLRAQHAEIEALKAAGAGVPAITDEMRFAGARAIIDGMENRPGSSWADEAERVFTAMLAAAPKPPEAQGDVIDRIVAVLHTIKDEVPAIAAQRGEKG